MEILKRVEKRSLEALFHQPLMLHVAVVGEGINSDAPARSENAFYFDIFRVHKLTKVLQDDVDAIFMKVAMVAKTEKVEFQTFAFNHALTRDIVDDYFREVGLPCFGTQRSELGASESDEILVVGVLVDKSFKHFGSILSRVFHSGVAKE